MDKAPASAGPRPLFGWRQKWPASIRISFSILALIAVLSLFGPLVSPHPYDRVYRDFILAPPSLVPHPSKAEAMQALKDAARRLRLRLDDASMRGETLQASLSAAQPIDARVLRVFGGSDLFAPPTKKEFGDEGRQLRLELPLKRLIFPFGTDANGRDFLTRVLVAGRVSLSVGLLGCFVALAIGVAYGAIAGYLGGRADILMMRLVEIIYALPFIFFVIVLVMVFGRRFALIFVAIGAVEWLDMARIVRGQTLSIKQREYVAAAEALGAGTGAIIRRHIIPNAASPIIAYLTLLAPRVILLESFISFLGFGVQEPLASWGVLIADGARNVQGAIHLLLFPAIFLGAALGALQYLGDGLRASLGAGDQGAFERANRLD